MTTAITTEQVKALRDQTGVSVMQCRKALEEASGDMEKALIILRKKGSEVAEKKADRTANDGRVVIKQEGGKAVALTLYCETDFVAQNADFIALAEGLADIALREGVEKAKEIAPERINDVILKIGENIQLGSIELFEGSTIGSYTHFNGKTASLVILQGGTEDVAKGVAMHVAAMKPKYQSSNDITEEEKNAVIDVLKKEVEESDKPEEIKEKMLDGKITAYFKEQTLLDQPFFKQPEISIETYIKNNGGALASFRLYQLG